MSYKITQLPDNKVEIVDDAGLVRFKGTVNMALIHFAMILQSHDKLMKVYNAVKPLFEPLPRRHVPVPTDPNFRLRVTSDADQFAAQWTDAEKAIKEFEE